MGHAGGQKTHAGQLLAADRLLGADLHLAVQVVANLLKSGGHVVQGLGQFGHLVVGVQADAVAELTRGHAPRAGNQHPQRPEDPAIGKPHEDEKQQAGRYGCRPCADDQRVVLPADLAGKAGQLRLQVAGQFGGQHLQAFELHVQPADLDVVQHPVFLVIGRADAGQLGLDLADRLPLAVVVRNPRIGPFPFGLHLAGQMVLIACERLVEFVQLAAELVADHRHSRGHEVMIQVGEGIDLQGRGVRRA